jgi:hypothetical protein
MSRTIESLDGLLARVVAEDRRKYDVIADTRSMSVGVHVNEEGKGDDVELDLDTPGADLRSFRLTPHMQGQISTDLGIPKRYFDRMRVDAPALFETNVRHWMTSEPKARMVRGYTNEDGQMMTGRAWMSDKFRRLDNIEVARTLLPEFDKLGTEVTFHQASITETKLYIRALFPQIERDVKHVGDTVRWGVEIGNSEVGAGALTIKGFVLKLSCTNGMTAAKVLNSRHVGRREDEGVLSNQALAADDVAFWLAARDTLRHVCSEAAFETVVAQLKDAATSIEIASPIAATKVLAQQVGLTEDEGEAVLLSLIKEGDLTRWGALNAITDAAKAAESFDRQAELEGIGWDVANMAESAWERVALAVK